MPLISKMMKRLVSLIFIVVASTVAGSLLMKLENGTLTLWPRDLVEDTMEQIATIDPMTHAVLSDHMEETRAIIESASETEDWDTGRKTIVAMAAKYSAPALSRTNDAIAIAAAEKALNLVEVLSAHHQKGCVRFMEGSISTPDFSIPPVGLAYKIYSEALKTAYIDGKSNKPSEKLSLEQLAPILKERLGFTENDGDALQNPAGVEPRQLCEALKKFFNTKLVPPPQQGAYARTIIAGG
jgi:hypothetical protein